MNQFTSVLTTEMMRQDTPRNPVSLYIKDYIEPARQSVKTALEEYQKGNKEPLAKIISRGMEFSDTASRISYDLADTTQATLKMASYLTAFMERDPKLKELATADYEKRESAICASRKDFPAMRTMDMLIDNTKGYAVLRELQKKSCEASGKLLKAKAGMLTLSEQETKDALRDMMKHAVMESSYKSQTKNLSDAASNKAMATVADIAEKYAGHESLSVVAVTASTLLHPRYVEAAPEGKTPVLESLRDQKFMNSLDKHLEQLIERDSKALGSPQALRDKVLGGENAYTGEQLLNTLSVGKQPAAPGKQTQSEAVKEQQQPENTVSELEM